MATANGRRLPSWRPGPTRDSVVAFLEMARDLPVQDRLACFDNDGTLWCERPTYIQYEFFAHELAAAAAADPGLADRPEFAAVLGADRSAMGELGLVRIATALVGLFEGMSPEDFDERARRFMASATHPGLGRPLRALTYQPMLELIAELRALDFTVSIATGGGSEFVRAVSRDLYGVPPELVVGSRIAYDVDRDVDGVPILRRTAHLDGDPAEGAVKLRNIQSHFGRRPILAAGNSGGDREMLDWTHHRDGPSLALLVDHDDEQREYAYASEAATVAEDRPITEVGTEEGWTVVSMKHDWEAVFAPLP